MEKEFRGLITGFSATLPARSEIGHLTSLESFPQKQADPTGVRDRGVYLCSSSSRGCGYVEKCRLHSSVGKSSSTAVVESVWINSNALWMKHLRPQGIHNSAAFVHRFSSKRSTDLGITSSLKLVIRGPPAAFMHRTYPQPSTVVEKMLRVACMPLKFLLTDMFE
jgi:hypothetical protein